MVSYELPLKSSIACHTGRVVALCMGLVAFAFCGCGKKQSADEITMAGLLKNLEATDAELRVEAAVALGMRKDRAAVPALCKALDDIRPDVREAAIEALGQIGDPAAVNKLSTLVGNDKQGEEQPRLAASALGNIGSPAAVPALADALNSDDKGLVHRAAYSLALIGGDTAFDALVAAIETGSGHGRQAAAAAVGNFANERSRKILNGLLNDRDPNTRLSAAENLVAMDDAQAIPGVVNLLIDPDKTVRLGVRRLIPRIAKKAIDPLTEIMKLPGPHVERKTADGKTIKVALRQPRQIAATALTALEGDKVVRPLILSVALPDVQPGRGTHERVAELMKDPAGRAELFSMAEQGEVPGTFALNMLFKYFTEIIGEAGLMRDRKEAIKSLGIPDTARFLKLAARLLKNSEPEVQFKAAQLLCWLGDARGKALLVKTFWEEVDKLDKLRAEAEKTWKEREAKINRKTLRGERLKQMMRHWDRQKKRGRNPGPKPTLADVPTVDELIEEQRRNTVYKALGSSHADRASRCLKALIGVADKKLTDDLIRATKMGLVFSGAWVVIHNDIGRLVQKTPDPRYLDPLLKLMVIPKAGRLDRWNRTGICRGLGAIGDPRAFDAIAAYEPVIGMHDGGHCALRNQVYLGMYGCDRKRAAAVVGGVMARIPPSRRGFLTDTATIMADHPEPGAVPGLVNWLDHDIADVQEHIADELARLAEGHIEWLVDGFEVTAHTKRSALAGMIADKFGNDALPALKEAAGDERPRIRQGVVWTVAAIGGDESSDIVKAMLNDKHPGVRSAAVWAAGRLKAASLSADVRTILRRDEDKNVRSMAAEQLGILGGAESVKSLVEALKDKEPPVRAYSALALAKLKAVDAAGALEAMESEEDPDVRAAVEYALRVLRPPKPQPAKGAPPPSSE